MCHLAMTLQFYAYMTDLYERQIEKQAIAAEQQCHRLNFHGIHKQCGWVNDALKVKSI